MSDRSRLGRTLSVCPVCLRVVEAEFVSKAGAVYFRKNCVEHGASESMIWPQTEHFRWMYSFLSFLTPFNRPDSVIPLELGCPRDCGLCVRHLRQPTAIEIEVTSRCNLQCPLCFISSDTSGCDVARKELDTTLCQIRERAGVKPRIQLTGGEPTIRQDLPEIVRTGKSLGFENIQISTNGIVISRDFDYLLRLKEAGLNHIRLQFDGLSDEVYRQIRGTDLHAEKLKAIENCRGAGLKVSLGMTVIDGVNLNQLGRVLRFALENVDVINELTLWPALSSKHFEAPGARRLSMGDLIFALAEQCPDLLGIYDFYPQGHSHPLCSCGTYLVREADTFVPVTRSIPCQSVRPGADSRRGREALPKEGQPLENVAGLSLEIMNIMDIGTIDLDRLQQCSMVVAAPSGGMIPFCSYHLAGCNGQSIRHGVNSHLATVCRGKPAV